MFTRVRLVQVATFLFVGTCIYAYLYFWVSLGNKFLKAAGVSKKQCPAKKPAEDRPPPGFNFAEHGSSGSNEEGTDIEFVPFTDDTTIGLFNSKTSAGEWRESGRSRGDCAHHAGLLALGLLRALSEEVHRQVFHFSY